jgi:cadmium resistance protein CadD (predicted permease)
MYSSLTIVPIAAGAFIATNLDNLILLVSLLARYRSQKSHVVAAYFVYVFVIGLLGFGIGATAEFVPVEYLGLLGIAPIAIGTLELARMRQGKHETIALDRPSTGSVRTAFLATLFIQIANGTDTVITFGALFTDSTRSADLLIIFTMAAMAAIFVLTANHAIRHPAFGEVIERHAYRVTPFILIAVGSYILANTATDLMPG